MCAPILHKIFYIYTALLYSQVYTTNWQMETENLNVVLGSSWSVIYINKNIIQEIMLSTCKCMALGYFLWRICEENLGQFDPHIDKYINTLLTIQAQRSYLLPFLVLFYSLLVWTPAPCCQTFQTLKLFTPAPAHHGWDETDLKKHPFDCSV